MLKPLWCDCGWHGPPKAQWRTFDDGRRHVEGSCKRCGKWLKWLEQTPEVLEAALPEPEDKQGSLF